MKKAAIDLGTNTCLLLIVEKSGDVIVEDINTVVRLGQGVDQNRALHPDAIQRTKNCLATYKEVLKKHGITTEQVVCAATSQARDAKNGKQFFSEIENELGFKFRVLSGYDEAKYTFSGALSKHSNKDSYCVIDIGGGSTEFTTHSSQVSFDMGSVRFTERFLKSNPVTDEEFWSCQKAIDEQLKFNFNFKSSLKLLAVAGTATTLAQWFLGLEQFQQSKIDEIKLSQGDLHRMVEELKWRTYKEREELPGVTSGRADVLLAGAMILWRSVEILSFKEVEISTRGLRFGILNLSSS